MGKDFRHTFMIQIKATEICYRTYSGSIYNVVQLLNWRSWQVVCHYRGAKKPDSKKLYDTSQGKVCGHKKKCTTGRAWTTDVLRGHHHGIRDETWYVLDTLYPANKSPNNNVNIATKLPFGRNQVATL